MLLWTVTARTVFTMSLFWIRPIVLLPAIEGHDHAQSLIVNTWHAYTVPVCFRVLCARGLQTVFLPTLEGIWGNFDVRQCWLRRETSISYITSLPGSDYLCRRN